MEQNRVRFKDGIRHFFTVPKDIRAEYWQESLRKNRVSLLVICIITFLTEPYNIIRVLFLSRSGLATLNNRIYFGMYCFLLAAAAFWLLLQPALRRAPVKAQWAAQYTTILIFFLWHVLLNAYDLTKETGGSIVVFTTAILGLSVFIQMPSPFSILCFSTGFLLFTLLSAPALSGGTMLNLTITFLVALSVSLSNSHHAVNSLLQHREITRINAELKDLVKRDPMTGLLNKSAMEAQIEVCLEQIPKTGGATLFLLDVDDFKSINDRFGHRCGDLVLIAAAAELRAAFPDARGIGRVGGDEFAAVFDRPLPAETAMEMGARLAKCRAPLQSWNDMAVFGCSVGICVCSRTSVSCGQFYQEADQALYTSKQQGKARCSFCKIEGGPAVEPETASGSSETSGFRT